LKNNHVKKFVKWYLCNDCNLAYPINMFKDIYVHYELCKGYKQTP